LPLRHRSLQKHGTFFITTSTYNKIIRFNKREDFEIALNNIEYYRKRDNAKIHAYVIMPNHLHLLLTLPKESNISFFIRDVKKRIAFEYFKDRNMKNQKFWQYRFDDVYIYSEDIYRIKLNYIHYNPVKAGLVKKPEDWKYSSANYYLNGETYNVRVDPLEL
jgi:putative transposase